MSLAAHLVIIQIDIIVTIIHDSGQAKNSNLSVPIHLNLFAQLKAQEHKDLFLPILVVHTIPLDLNACCV